MDLRETQSAQHTGTPRTVIIKRKDRRSNLIQTGSGITSDERPVPACNSVKWKILCVKVKEGIKKKEEYCVKVRVLLWVVWSW